MDFDDILPLIGGFGRYQKFLIAFICLPASLPCSFFGFLYMFQIYLPNFKCREYNDYKPIDGYMVTEQTSCFLSLQNNLTLANSTYLCSSWVYEADKYKSSAAAQFNMVCDKSWLTQLTVSLFYAGSLCGHIIFGLVIDRWGRRVGFFLCLTIEIFFGILIVFSSNIYMFMICQFAIGFTIASIFDIPFVSAIELVGPTWRAFITILMCLTYSVGVVIFAVIAYFIRNWKILTLVVDIPFVVFYIYWWFLPESIRWLIVKEKYKEAEKIIQKAAKFNKKIIPPNFLHEKLVMSKRESVPLDDRLEEENIDITQNTKGKTINSSTKSVGLKDIFTHPNLRKKCLIISFAWVANVLSYVGIQNYLLFFEDLHLNFLLASLMELPGYVFLYFTLDRVGRKFPFSFSMLVSGISVLASNLFASRSKTAVLALALIGKLGISTSFVVIYLYGSELYPTELRGTGMGMTLTVSRIFTVAVPFVTFLGNTSIIIPTMIMGSVTTLAGICALLLPETVNQKLPETIAESEAVGLDYGVFKRAASLSWIWKGPRRNADTTTSTRA